MKALVSVIVPTYNHGEFIADAIESALLQTYSNVEVIVIDNFSTDNTKDVIEKYLDEPRFRCYQFDNKGVIAAARNFGVAQSSGEYLAFLDSDDIWKQDKLEMQFKYFDRGVVAISTNFELIGDVDSGYNHLDLIIMDNMFIDFSYKQILLCNPVMTSSLMMHKVDFQALGGFDESTDFRYIEDWELWLRLSRRGNIRTLGLPLLQYRVLHKPNRDYRDVAYRTVKVIEKQNNHQCVNSFVLKKAKLNCYASIGSACLSVGDKNCIIYFLKCLFGYSSISAKKRCLLGLFLSVFPKHFRSSIKKRILEKVKES